MKEKIVHKTLKQMQYEWKDELVNELYGENFYLIEEYNKHIEILNQIKEYIKEKDLTNNMNFMDDGIGNLFKDILELLEEIK